MAFTKEDGISLGVLAIVGGVVLPGFVTGYLVLSNYLFETSEEERVEKTYNANRAQYKSVRGEAEAKLKTQFKSNPGLDKTGNKDTEAPPSKELAKINIENAMDLVVIQQSEKTRLAAEAKSAASNSDEDLSIENEASKEQPAKGTEPVDKTENPTEKQDASVKKKQG